MDLIPASLWLFPRLNLSCLLLYDCKKYSQELDTRIFLVYQIMHCDR